MSNFADFHSLRYALLPYPATLAPMIQAVGADIVSCADGCIAFRYRVRGDMARVRVPEAGQPERRDLLWEHTCFEVFVGIEGRTAYREFNFSPSGQWMAYDFGDYRRRLADPEIATPRIATRSTEGRLELETIVPLSSLPSTPWEIGLSAIVEASDTVNDGLSYLALRHPSPRPDFHHRDGFAARV
ncbi:hypothetical protein AGMMS50256_06280 [Betaproteobacteria bacterium]|nr:hypothetical protein AGMMS50256_06280 [Betaproteobacteria bacterium]